MGVIIAVLGDTHGNWREAFALVVAACSATGVPASELAAIFQVGDAEPLRSEAEAAQVCGPAKYRKLGDFADVVTGELVAPAPVYFIAGNHEPFGALDADGGLVEGSGSWGPNVTYLGRAGSASIGGLRIGFLSGIFGPTVFRLSEAGELGRRRGKKAAHYTAQEHQTVRSAIAGGVDVLLTHDWPTGVGEVSRFGAPGDQRVRDMIEDYRPILSLHGHMHRPASAVIGNTQVACLAIVGYRSGDPMAAVGLWNIDTETRHATRLA